MEQTSDTNIDGFNYRINKMNALEQFHTARRLLPILSSMKSETESIDFDKLANFIADMDDDKANRIIFPLLSCVHRKIEGGLGYAPISKNNLLMYSDIDVSCMLKLMFHSFKVNLSDFMNALPSELNQGR